MEIDAERYRVRETERWRGREIENEIERLREGQGGGEIASSKDGEMRG